MRKYFEDWEWILCGWVCIVCFFIAIGGMH
jgi:hypothetical protein